MNVNTKIRHYNTEILYVSEILNVNYKCDFEDIKKAERNFIGKIF